MNIHQLTQRKKEIRTASDAILDAPAGDGGMLSVEQHDEVRAKIAELDQLESEIKLRARMAQEDETASGKVLAGNGGNEVMEYRVFANVKSTGPADVEAWRTPEGERVPVLSKEQRVADFVDANDSAAMQIGERGIFSAIANGPKNDLERRALTEGSASAGGVLLPAPMAAGIIDVARQKNAAFQAGARTIPMANKTLKMGKQLSDVAPEWRAESSAIALSDPTFGDVSLDAKSLAVIVKCSREWLEDVPNGDALIRQAMGAGFARGLDAAIFFGTGADNQPLGIANTPGITTVSMGTNGAAVTGWAPFLDAALELETVNEGKIDAIVMAPRTNRVIAGLTDTTGQPLQRPPSLANVPILSTTGVPVNETQGTATNATSAFLGDFSQVMVGIRTALQITVLHERYADTGEIGFVGWLRADVAIARPAAIAAIKGIKP